MTTTTTTNQASNELAFEMYAAEFGEKAAKRNAGRIEKLAELIEGSGAGSVTLREAHTSYWTEAAELKKSVAEAGGVILGSTNASSDRSVFVIADIVTKTDTVANTDTGANSITLHNSVTGKTDTITAAEIENADAWSIPNLGYYIADRVAQNTGDHSLKNNLRLILSQPSARVRDPKTGLQTCDMTTRREAKALLLSFIAGDTLPDVPGTDQAAPYSSATRGQLWEECPVCGTEPVCAACGYCAAHDKCGGIPQSSVSGEIYGGAL